MTTVLVAGGTGMLGSRIADYLVKETGEQVRLLVRDGWEDDDAKRHRVDPQGATIATFHERSCAQTTVGSRTDTMRGTCEANTR